MSLRINISKKLGEILVSNSLITEEQLKEALEYQRKTGLKLGQVLIEKKYITERQLLEFLSKQFSIRFVEISKIEIDPEIIKIVPEATARRYILIPISKTGNVVSVAMVDPLNIVVLDELKLMTGYNIEPVFALEDDIISAIDRYYGTSSSSQILDEIIKKSETDEDNVSVVSKKEEEDLSLESQSESGPIIKMVNVIISSAIKSHASDIHIEPSYKDTKVRFRIDGVLHPQNTIPKRFHNAIVSRLKIMSNLDISERRIPQDGRIKIKLSEKEIDLRVSVLPTIFGEKVVMRILDSSGLKLRLEELGFEPENLAIFSKCIKAPHGINLITGPTGSGKSTTLYSALSTLNSPDVNISTIEDPVEYHLDGINQVNVNPDVGLTFASGLRAFLRQDPDIIMVGEIRDFETMSIAINAAMTGHLVFSTLHTNDAPGAITRIGMMGIEPFLTSSTLLMVVAQRLVRTICKYCKEAYEVDPNLIIKLGAKPSLIEMNIKNGKLVLYKGKGCDRCVGTGYKGRIGIHEILEVTDPIRELIVDKAPSTKIKEVARKLGMITLRESALRKLINGITTVEEVIRVTGSDVD
jgi:type IV pilus assembly protein PilB